MSRRAFLRTCAAAGLYAALSPYLARAQARPLVYADMHSHIGLLGGRADVREAMVANGMLVVSRKIVTDGPVIKRFPGKGVQQVREPAPGELASRFGRVLAQMKAEHASANLIEIVDAATLKRVVGGSEPAVVLASEGADFIDGDLKRLEAARQQGLVHLQLVHYRVSDIGDHSTDRPVHNGLTALGKETVAMCDRLGILVDVAHCTPDGIAHALEASRKPMVYSHGHMVSTTPHWTQSGIRARAISSSQARAIAAKGGVIGIWPLGRQYGSLDGYASALIDTAQTVGIAHVGVGTDLFGLGGSTVIPGYEQFPQLEEVLLKRGLKPDEARGVLGGNYLRALGAALA
ncbi:MAG TPA: membrane dipeptidase [Burkholderiales bacterium]|nr:membrane dipeptidase [Burkholderiales bacterium]